MERRNICPNCKRIVAWDITEGINSFYETNQHTGEAVIGLYCPYCSCHFGPKADEPADDGLPF